jgi:transcriptional regulator with XRE-family HTH domain
MLYEHISSILKRRFCFKKETDASSLHFEAMSWKEILMDHSNEQEAQFPNDLSDEVLADTLDSEDAQLPFGEMLKKLREKKNKSLPKEQIITQRKLAQELGVRRATVTDWENGNYRPQRASVTEIARILKLSARDTTLLLNAVLIPTKRVPPGFTPENPYKGLAPFTEEDQQKFFGRTVFVQDIAQPFLGKESNTDRFLAVTGPSGCGKTSVVQAGLLPFLKGKKACKDWIYLDTIRPGSDPIGALAIAFTGHLQFKNTDEIRAHLEQSPQGIQELVQELTQYTEKQVVVIIDQGEELFTQVANSERRAHFFNLLVNASTEQPGAVWIVFVFRSDFYSQFQEHDAFAQLLEYRRCEVPPMDGEALRAVIEEPARDNNIEFDDDLTNTILVEMRGQVGYLPLLQFTLSLLFEHRAGNHITKGSYRAIGGVRGALANHAQSVCNLLPSEVHRNLVPLLFMRLMTVDMETSSFERATRRRTSLKEFEYPTEEETRCMREVIDTFVDQRLLQSGEALGVSTIEVSHEILLQEWSLCQALLRERHEDIHHLQQLSRDTMEWNRLKEYQRAIRRASGSSAKLPFRLPTLDLLEKFRESPQQKSQNRKPKDLLYRHPQLRAAKLWTKRNPVSKQEQAFLQASAKRHIQSVVSVIVLILLLVSSISTVGWFVLNQPNPTHVTNLADNGPGSLRWSIANAPSGSTITFSERARGTIRLTSGDLAFPNDKKLTIDGPGENALAISGSATSAIHVFLGASVTISDLSFKERRRTGYSYGSLIQNNGLLQLTRVIVSGNYAYRGTIYNDGDGGTLIVSNSTISGNSANAEGGGIYNVGKMTVNNSTISDNSASAPGGGIYNEGEMAVSNSTISGNSTHLEGGGIRNAGTLTVSNSTISGNSASGDGGGIANFKKMTVSNSTITGNSAKDQSVFSAGRSSNGGGIFNYVDSTLIVSNSTISDNFAAGNGSGIANLGGSTHITFCTIYNNRASDSGGILTSDVSDGTIFKSEMTVRNSIVVGNGPETDLDASGSFTSGGYNLIEKGTGATFAPATGDKVGSDLSYLFVKNVQLSDNGGPTRTLALLADSRNPDL